MFIALATSPPPARALPAQSSAVRALVLCAAVREPPAPALSRRAVVLAAPAACALLAPQAACADEADVVCAGQLQFSGQLPAGSTTTIIARVVGRNSGGPLATLALSDLDFSSGKLDFAISRRDLRDVPDFYWLEEDLFLRADVVDANGKLIFQAKGKSKAAEGKHKPAALELDRV